MHFLREGFVRKMDKKIDDFIRQELKQTVKNMEPSQQLFFNIKNQVKLQEENAMKKNLFASKKLKAAVDNVFKVNAIVLSTKINTGIKIKLDNPEEAGADRIANAAGAYVLYNHPVIVVDFGTATTFDIVNEKGEFIGGVISLGIMSQMKALNKFTSKLPRTDVTISNSAIGHNTNDAILSGVIRGTACMIDGLVEQCEKELGKKSLLIATGGYSGLIANYLKRPFDFINPTLTLEGLRYLYEINKSDVISELQEVSH